MSIVKTYRRIDTGMVVEAIQYQLNRAVNVAAFVLGRDANKGVTIANEHILDVVTPISKTWDPPLVADISVSIPGGHMQWDVSLSDWVIRDSDGQISFCTNEFFQENYLEIQPPAPKTDFEELSDVIYGSFSTLEGDLYQALAETAAAAVIEAGWTKGGQRP